MNGKILFPRHWDPNWLKIQDFVILYYDRQKDKNPYTQFQEFWIQSKVLRSTISLYQPFTYNIQPSFFL